MALQWDRTSFDRGFAKVFHVVPYGSTFYSDLCQKYGADNVFQPTLSTAEDVAFRNAVAACTTGRNDLIRVYPGTYTFAAVVTVNKGCTIESATGFKGDVIIDVNTSDVVAFAITAVSVALKNMVFQCSNTDIHTITSTAASTLLQNLTFIGQNQASATIDSDGDYTVIDNCNLYNVKLGIELDGSYCDVTNNLIYGSHTTNVGIELTGSGTGKNTACRLISNILNLQGATGTTAGIKVPANATGCAASFNAFAVVLDKDIVAPAVTDCEMYYSVVSNTSAAGQVGAVVSTS